MKRNINYDVGNPDNFKPIEIVPPLERNVQNDLNNGIGPIDCDVDESTLPVLNNSTASSYEYQSASSTDSEGESTSDQETSEPVTGSFETRG